MASPTVATRNQQNAQHSTGPRTPEGKQASCRNAVRHGLTSQQVVLSTEDQAEYAHFQASLLADLKPQGTVESMLVQTACDAQWRLERARTVESNILALSQYEEVPPHLAAITDDAERRALLEAHAWTKHERALRNLQHHEARLQRLLLKTLSDLRTLQDRREAKTQQLLTEAACTKVHHLSNDLPFEPAALGFVFTEAQIDTEMKRVHVLNFPRKPMPTFAPQPKTQPAAA